MGEPGSALLEPLAARAPPLKVLGARGGRARRGGRGVPARRRGGTALGCLLGLRARSRASRGAAAARGGAAGAAGPLVACAAPRAAWVRRTAAEAAEPLALLWLRILDFNNRRWGDSAGRRGGAAATRIAFPQVDVAPVSAGAAAAPRHVAATPRHGEWPVCARRLPAGGCDDAVLPFSLRLLRLAPRRRRGTSCVHVGGVACVRRLRAGGLFSLSFFLFGDGLRPRVARCHRVPMRLRLFSWSGYRPCVRRAAAGSGGRRGAAERRPCYDSSSLAAIRAFRYVLLYSGRPQPPHGFPPSCATRAPLGSCPN